MNELKKFLLIFALLPAVVLVSGQPKKIYIAPDDHTDYMWSSNEEGYRMAFLKTLDYYIRLNDSTAKDPYPYQSKWNCDGSYWIYTFEKNRSKEEFASLIRQIKDEKIIVPLNTLAGLHGAAPTEATIRDMYYAGSLEKRFGLDLDLVINMEDQVLPLGLSSLWAGAGARYSWRGVCDCVTKVKGFESRPHEIYWYRGLDDQKILMKWYSLMINNKYLGGYAEARDPVKSVSLGKELMNTPKYPYNIVGLFGKGWDDLYTTTREFVDVARKSSDKDYQIIVSNEIDFFRDFEREYGDKLPSESVSYGSTEWGISMASLADVSASIKRSMEKLRTAEALYTLAALKDRNFASELKEKREKAWIACGLYFEHDWTMDGTITKKQRADWHRKTAKELSSYVDTLYNMSLNRMSGLISSEAKNESFFVLNPLSWKRSDYCDYLYEGSSAIRVTDKITKKEVPFQMMEKQNRKFIRIFAEDVPALGYKVFEINTVVQKPTLKRAASVSNGTIENDYYAIKVTPEGVMTSLIDKLNNHHQFISPVNKLLANDLGTGDKVIPVNDRPLRVENEGPVSVTLVAESYRPIKHTTKITLFKHSDRIEIENYITQNMDEKPVSYSFSFNLTNPEIHHEEAGAVLTAKPVSKGGHYAEKICRLDWLAINHFADISDKENGVILSNRDAFFMQTGQSKIDSMDYTTPQIHIMAGGQVDAPNLGIISQDGDSYFENFFALKPYSGNYNPTLSMKFSLEHQNPLTAGRIKSKTNAYQDHYSLFQISDPNVLVWAVKPAEEGIEKGIILRVWNTGDQDSYCTISSERAIVACNRTTHIEKDEMTIIPDKGKIRTTIGHNRIQTYRLFLK